jgi:hypothetical protein
MGTNTRTIEEDIMKNKRSFKFPALVVTIITVMIFAAAALQAQKTGFDKICPISFELSPSSILTTNCAAKVESDNAMLAIWLAQQRQKTGIIRVPIYGSEKVTKASSTVDFDVTYLKNPTLRLADGKEFIGWDDIIPVLTGPKGIIQNSTYIDVQSVHVDLEYVKGDDNIDFIAHVKTVLAYAPYDDPVTIQGVLCHQRICAWVPGPCPPPQQAVSPKASVAVLH